MKNLQQYIIESTKTYSFKIKAAGELPENFEDQLETALNKYQIVNFSKGSKTPITEKPLDFPQLQNCEVTHFDVELNYPTTNGVLESYLTLELGFPDTHLLVRNENDPLEEVNTIDNDKDKTYETLLTKEDLGGESGQDSVGAKRVMDLLKELEKVKKENEFDPIKGISAPKD